MSDTLKELLVSHGVLMSHGGESSHPIVEPSLPLHNANDPAQAHTISVVHEVAMLGDCHTLRDGCCLYAPKMTTIPS